MKIITSIILSIILGLSLGVYYQDFFNTLINQNKEVATEDLQDTSTLTDVWLIYDEPEECILDGNLGYKNKKDRRENEIVCAKWTTFAYSAIVDNENMDEVLWFSLNIIDPQWNILVGDLEALHDCGGDFCPLTFDYYSQTNQLLFTEAGWDVCGSFIKMKIYNISEKSRTEELRIEDWMSINIGRTQITPKISSNQFIGYQLNTNGNIVDYDTKYNWSIQMNDCNSYSDIITIGTSPKIKDNIIEINDIFGNQIYVNIVNEEVSFAQ